MRILYVTTADLSRGGGDIVHILGVANGLAELGHEVHLVAQRSTTSTVATFSEKLILHPVNPPRDSGVLQTIRLVPRTALQIVPKLLPDIAYVRAFPLDWVFLTRGLRRLGVPYVYELNTIIDKEYKAQGKSFRGRLFQLSEKQSLRSSRGWLPVTEEIGVYARVTAKVERPWILAENGFFPTADTLDDSARSELRKSLGVSENAIVLIMAGYSRPWHGVDRAISMLHHLSDLESVHMWLVGARSLIEKESVMTLAEKYRVVDRVTVLPWMSDTELTRYVGAADIGLGPLAMDRKSLREAQPIKVGTYLAHGLPVLINYVDPRLDPKRQFVSYVDSSDPVLLASGVKRLLPLTRELRQEAIAFAHENLTWLAIARKTEAFLRSLTL